MNSVANGKIHKKTPYKKIYIPPSPGDSGGYWSGCYNNC